MKEQTTTSVYHKLSQARKILRSETLTKSGRNDFAHYNYFELGDFLPQSLDAFDQVGLAGVVSFGREEASLAIVDIATGDRIVITSPMSTAELKGCHAVQNLGAVQTYLRRYLWSAAMELIEGDPLDGSKPVENGQSAKVPPKPLPQRPQTTTPTGNETTWKGYIAKCEPYEGQSASGKPFTRYLIYMDDDKEAGTFDEKLWKRAKAIGVEEEVLVTVIPNKRNAKYWDFTEVKKVEPELGDDQQWE